MLTERSKTLARFYRWFILSFLFIFFSPSLSFTKCATPRKTTRRSGRASAATTPYSASCLKTSGAERVQRRPRREKNKTKQKKTGGRDRKTSHAVEVPWAFARMLRQTCWFGSKRQWTKQTAKRAAVSSLIRGKRWLSPKDPHIKCLLRVG